ncbi:hAT dimerization domain-containing protein / transposase-like protein [Perilla frutescens var. hirtella]|uniref:HAT dimerization domain-containing protein / transposase-like protein n=1 Tax=Perilla frutescens var. hirtella TaxID=608512 RepID=A0AAD4J656_PERFH|nr:hAT dimerization domain-containing protein / transposase-like protein [Perilla frutescens var. hirtella]
MSYKTQSPVDWWEQFGDDVPELKAFATTVLGLTCSSSTCERNWTNLNANDKEDDSFEIEDEGTSSPAPKKMKKNQAPHKGKGKKVQGLVDKEFDEELEYQGEKETESGDGYCSY